EPGRTIAWQPGQYGSDGSWGSAGWVWRYDLASAGEGTRVTLTYDWSAVPEALRAEFGLPPFPPSFLEQALESLEKALGTGSGAEERAAHGAGHPVTDGPSPVADGPSPVADGSCAAVFHDGNTAERDFPVTGATGGWAAPRGPGATTSLPRPRAPA